MAPTHKIAVIQMWPKPLDLEGNYKKAEQEIRAAATQGAHLAVLPEYHLLNWVPHDSNFRPYCRQWKDYLEKYQALAKECNINLVPGTILELLDEGKPSERLLNVAYFISNTGEILGRYQKKNLWGPVERDHLESSTHDPHVAFDTPLGKVGMLICWDLAFPEAFRELISQGAKLIVIPTFWKLDDGTDKGRAINPACESLFLDSILVGRCFENTCAIAFCNAGGPAGENYCGLSQICMPYAGAVARLGSHAEGMAIADVDMQVLEFAEENYAVRADLARSDWHYTYRHSVSCGKTL